MQSRCAQARDTNSAVASALLPGVVYFRLLDRSYQLPPDPTDDLHLPVRYLLRNRKRCHPGHHRTLSSLIFRDSAV